MTAFRGRNHRIRVRGVISRGSVFSKPVRRLLEAERPMKAQNLPILFALLLAAACGGDDDEAANAKTVNQLDGTYKPSDPAHSELASITFSGNVNYLLMPAGCQSGACAEIGKYRIDQETSTLWLGARSMPLEVLATTPSNATLVKQSLRIMGDLVDPGTSLAQGGQQLNQGSGQQLAEQISQLIQTITQMIMSGQQMNQQNQGQQNQPQDPQNQNQNQNQNPKKPNPLDCTQGVPTAGSTQAETLAYFARCPGGP